MDGLTYWFSGLSDPNESKGLEIEIFGYDVSAYNRLVNAYRREELITQRLLRKLAAEAILTVIFKS